jgi:hypothetical protein|tara:strand:+ start:999 stop:1823 length:825 start_codon:yes stop_codon:yes gene_type:complete
MKLELKKFDISTITDDKVVVMIGKRNTGKSFLIKDLLFHNNSFQVGTVISGTESANGFFGEIIPRMFIHDEYKQCIIDNVVKRQTTIMKNISRENAKYGSCQIDPRAFLILDDCLYDSSWTKDKNVRALFMNGRHLKMFFVISMQYPLGIPPNLRTNIDFIFILRENIVANRKRIYDNYAGMFQNFEIFCQVMDQCTENFECLVIDNTTKSNKIEDNVFWYKADTHPQFKICNQQFWDLSNKMGNDEEEVEEDYDPSKLRKKSSLKINVKKKHG